MWDSSNSDQGVRGSIWLEIDPIRLEISCSCRRRLIPLNLSSFFLDHLILPVDRFVRSICAGSPRRSWSPSHFLRLLRPMAVVLFESLHYPRQTIWDWSSRSWPNVVRCFRNNNGPWDYRNERTRGRLHREGVWERRGHEIGCVVEWVLQIASWPPKTLTAPDYRLTGGGTPILRMDLDSPCVLVGRRVALLGRLGRRGSCFGLEKDRPGPQVDMLYWVGR